MALRVPSSQTVWQPVPDRMPACLLLLGACLAGWPSFAALLPLADGETPVSFLPVVPLVAAGWILWRADATPRGGDRFVDIVCALLLVALMAALLVVLPVTMSWQYWLDRLDIPAMVVLLALGVLLLWGVPGLGRQLPPLLYLLLAWPLPHLILDAGTIPVLTHLTAATVSALALRLPISVHSVGPDTLLVKHSGAHVQLVIAQACAGFDGLAAFLVVMGPVAIESSGHWEDRARWLIGGAAACWVANIIRLLLLIVAAATLGPGIAMHVMHPFVGYILFAAVCILALSLAQPLGLTLPEWKGQTTGTGGWPVRRLCMVCALLLLAGMADRGATQASWLRTGTMPRIQVRDATAMVRVPAGWSIRDSGFIDGWQSLFGAPSSAGVMTLSHPGWGTVGVQAVATRDASTFAAYGVEACYQFHGYSLVRVHHVPLGSGATGTSIDFKVGNRRMSALYWLQPVRASGVPMTERVVLVATAGQTARDAAPAPTPAPAERLGDAIADVLGPWFGGRHDPAYDSEDAHLQGLAAMIIALERHA